MFEDQELDEKVVVSKMENTTRHSAIENRTQTNEVKIYNLDAIIAVGYRVLDTDLVNPFAKSL